MGQLNEKGSWNRLQKQHWKCSNPFELCYILPLQNLVRVCIHRPSVDNMGGSETNRQVECPSNADSMPGRFSIQPYHPGA